MYLRHRDLFDAACRMRGRFVPPVELMALDFLRHPLSLPDDPSIGSVRLREITLLDETTGWRDHREGADRPSPDGRP